MQEPQYGIKIDRNIDFSEILNVLDLNDEKSLIYILFIEARGELKSGESMLDFENRVKNNKKGIAFTNQKLRNLLKSMEDIMNLHLVHYKHDKLKTNIIFFDSSFWLINSTDKKLINTISEKFKNKTEAIDPKLIDKYINWL